LSFSSLASEWMVSKDRQIQGIWNEERGHNDFGVTTGCTVIICYVP
jgi:hypothetical protein